MTLEEAQKVARVISFVDGGCGPCATDALADLGRAFPEFTWMLNGEPVDPLDEPTWLDENGEDVRISADVSVVMR